jgi:rhodanese-related sulfurtransferase
VEAEPRPSRLSIAVVVFLCACAGAANAAEVPAPGAASVFDGTLRDKDPVPEISTSDLQAALKDKQVVVLDARPFAEYAVSHIPGARCVPGKPGLSPAQYTADPGEVIRTVPDRSRPLVVYCNGPFCGRSKRFGAELHKAGYQSVRRYQLGIPTWRALGGVTQVEKEALVALMKTDGTAVLVDARDSDAVRPRLPNARLIPLRDASKAKDDGRLPMSDHNTRIFVIGDNGGQARAVAEAIVRDAFHNVSFYDGSLTDLPELARRPAP